MEAILIKKIKEETGKDYKAWAKILAKDGPEKYREQIKWLKEKGLKHGQASIMASILKNWEALLQILKCTYAKVILVTLLSNNM